MQTLSDQLPKLGISEEDARIITCSILGLTPLNIIDKIATPVAKGLDGGEKALRAIAQALDTTNSEIQSLKERVDKLERENLHEPE